MSPVPGPVKLFVQRPDTPTKYPTAIYTDSAWAYTQTRPPMPKGIADVFAALTDYDMTNSDPRVRVNDSALQIVVVTYETNLEKLQT
ncbi:hypothetical protein ElyMa_003509200 [Elysia marginata]|uniref:Uncharacterized protein n=1 Tax=Elysia marginata TaxID=1093978 RepID=A0AAV4EG89_9GAST|nr:hypothetical protein ElyMa_003509200 [Elysia marginata]